MNILIITRESDHNFVCVSSLVCVSSRVGVSNRVCVSIKVCVSNRFVYPYDVCDEMKSCNDVMCAPRSLIHFYFGSHRCVIVAN